MKLSNNMVASALDRKTSLDAQQDLRQLYMNLNHIMVSLFIRTNFTVYSTA